MKKISTQFLLAAFSFIVIAGCSKEVKAPVSKVQTMAASIQTSSGSQNTNQNQGGHTCGGNHSGNSSSNSNSY
jgi:hypothetical protein